MLTCALSTFDGSCTSEGVYGINVGVNDASAPVDVPSIRACKAGEISTPFIWADEQSNTSVIASFHPGGYGRIGNGLNCDCIAVPGLDEAMCYGACRRLQFHSLTRTHTHTHTTT